MQPLLEPPIVRAAAYADLTTALAGFPPLGGWVSSAACGPLTLDRSEVFLSSVNGSDGRAPVHGVWGGRWYERSRTRGIRRTAA